MCTSHRPENGADSYDVPQLDWRACVNCDHPIFGHHEDPLYGCSVDIEGVGGLISHACGCSTPVPSDSETATMVVEERDAINFICDTLGCTRHQAIEVLKKSKREGYANNRR